MGATTPPVRTDEERLRVFVDDIFQVKLFMLAVDTYHSDPTKLLRYWRTVAHLISAAFEDAAA